MLVTETKQYRADLPPLPDRIKSLPVDDRGYPVPWFVAWIDGKADFRIVGRGKFVDAVKNRRCWICGDPLGRYMAFVAGCMCGINRTSSEPPCHLDCAMFAAIACPFMVRPTAKRREAGLAELGTVEPGGVMIQRNPGVAMVYVTKSYKVWNPGNGALIEMGEPTDVFWFREGRPASRAEVDESIHTGMPLLEKMAREDKDPEGAQQELRRYVARFAPWLPRLA